MFLIRRDPTRLEEVEALSRYVDSAIADESAQPAPVVESFSGTVRALRADLRPVDADPEFVSTLRLRLVAAADQRSPVAVPAAAAWRQPRFIIGAAGLVSAAAVLAFVARSRMQGARVAA